MINESGPDLPHWLNVLLSVVGGVTGFGLLVRAIIMRLLGDKTVLGDIAKRESLLKSLQEEAERSRINERNALDRERAALDREGAAVREVGELRGQVQALTTQVEDLKGEIKALREILMKVSK